MEESILSSIKKLLGISNEDESFDTDLVIHINTIFAILEQMGSGYKLFSITDSSARWSDYLEDSGKLDMIKTFVFLRVRMLFDPPTSASLLESTNNLIKELEWRIYITDNH